MIGFVRSCDPRTETLLVVLAAFGLFILASVPALFDLLGLMRYVAA
jgi:hypothetical protein